MNHNVVLSLKILMSSEDFQGNHSTTTQTLKTMCELRLPGSMPCITYDLPVRVWPWEFGSSPT